MPKLTGNKGEWSEIYVFLRLLEVGRLYAANADLEKIDDIFYNIIIMLSFLNLLRVCVMFLVLFRLFNILKN